MKKLNKKGFSLVELLVAMAIIAVLISIAAFGISIVQRNARNTQRRKELDNIRLALIESELNAPAGQTVTGMSVAGSVISFTPASPGGSYTVTGFNTVTVLAGAACTSATAETSSTTLSVCMSGRTLRSRMEGSTTVFQIDLGS